MHLPANCFAFILCPFVVSYHEEFTKTDGDFTLVLKQKKDRIDYASALSGLTSAHIAILFAASRINSLSASKETFP